MSTSTIELSPSLQSLVDQRLDAVERVLLITKVSRGERRGILDELEAHVHELLGRRNTGQPTAQDVTAVLAQLDPPESYAPEGFDPAALHAAWALPRPREPRLSLGAASSAVAGALLLPVLAIDILVEHEQLLFVLAMALVVVSLVGCFSLARIQRSGGWLYGLRPALFAALLFPLLLANWLAVVGISAFDELGVFLGLAIAFLTLNTAIVYTAWRLCRLGLRPRK